MRRLTISDIARIAGKSRTTIYRQLDRRGVPHEEGQPIAVHYLLHHKIIDAGQLAAWDARQVTTFPPPREILQYLYTQTPRILAHLEAIDTTVQHLRRILDRMSPPEA